MSEYLYVVGFLEDIAGAPLPGDGITARALGGTYIDIDADHSGVVSAPAVADGEVRLRLHRKPGVVYELTSPGRMVPRFVSCSDHPSGATLYLHDLPPIPGLGDDDHSAVYVRFTIGASGPAVPRAGDFWMVTP